MTRSTLLSSLVFAGIGALFAGCAGQLTDAEKEFLGRDLDGGNNVGGAGGVGGAGPGAGGSGNTGGTGGSTGGTGGGTGGATGGTGGTTGGAGGAAGSAGGGMLDPCMAPIVQAKCSLTGCHGGGSVAAGLDLSAAVISAPTPLVDKLNRGETGSCMASVAKIVDSARPEQSLLYTKITTPTCGAKMPPSGPLAAAEITCVLNWIKSIPGVGTGGTGGTGGAAGAGGTGGMAGARDGGRG